MPPKPRIKLESRFPAVKEAAWDTVRHARDKALDDGEQEAKRRMERSQHDLDPGVVQQEKRGFQSGAVFIPSEKWYYRYLEYGTVYIAATPFMRPAHRKMRKTFKDEMGEQFEKFVRRRVRIR
jgi:HK97 gp10 family phage protein